MTSLRNTLALYAVCASMAFAQGDIESRIARVEKGLLPPVLVRGERGWDIAERMRFYKCPGVSIAVIRDNQIDWAKGYGVREAGGTEPITSQTVFQAASISKPVTAMAALKLVELGHISLDQDINEFLKTWKLSESRFTSKNKATLRRLLSHTAGITVHGFPGYAEGATLPTIVQILDGQPPANTETIRVDTVPGTISRYSGGGIVMVQCALIDREGKTFPEIMKERVIDPLGMTRSTYCQPLPESWRSDAASGHYPDMSVVPGKYHVYPEMAPAGLWTTPSDLARFAIEISQSLEGKSNRVLSQEMTRQMLTPVLDDAGLGVFIERRGSTEYVGHNGANEGFRSQMVFQRSGGNGAVVMINGSNFDIINEIIYSIAREYRWDDYLPQPHDTVHLSEREESAIVGKYLINADDAIEIRRGTDGLTLLGTETRPVKILPTSSRTFIRRDWGITYSLVHESHGVFDTLRIKSPDGLQSALRVDGSYRTPYELIAAGERKEGIAAYRRILRDGPDGAAVSEDRLNRLGYQRLNAKDIDGAIALFGLNVELYPASWNVYDSLGEAYAVRGDRESAIANYQKSVSLNPQNTSGINALRKLQMSRSGSNR